MKKKFKRVGADKDDFHGNSAMGQGSITHVESVVSLVMSCPM